MAKKEPDVNYFADSAAEYIITQMDSLGKAGGQSRLLMMVPSLPAEVTLDLGKRLDSICIQNGRWELVFKVAKSLAAEWPLSPELQQMENRNWIDHLGNLTSYRNSAAVGIGKLGMVVLVGTDRVTDSSGLADFHRCSIDTIWREQLDRSFGRWVRKRLEAASVAYDDDTIAHFDDVLGSLCEQGRADVLQISDLLSNLQLESRGAQNGNMAEAILLRSLKRFDLPSFAGFTFKKKRLSPYIESAGRFFSYNLFLEERSKDKALEAISLFLGEKSEEIRDNRLFTDDQRGVYTSDRGFLDALRGYVAQGDYAMARQLMDSDFITIWDEILKFKTKTPKERKETVRKLSGGPVEVVLTALWQTLREFRREVQSSNPELTRVEIKSERFKHDYECEYEDHKPSAAEVAQEAMSHLRRLVGGIDQFFSTRTETSPLDGYLDLSRAYDGRTVAVECQLLHEEIVCAYARTAEPALEFRISLTTGDSKEPFSRKFAWRLPETQTYRLAEELVAWARDGLARSSDGLSLPVFHVPHYEELIRAKDDDEIRRVLLHCTRDDEDRKAVNMLTPRWAQTNDPLLPYLERLARAYGVLLKEAESRGLHATFQVEMPGPKSAWDQLRQAFEEAAVAFVGDHPVCQGSPMAAMLMRAFLIVRTRQGIHEDTWTSVEYERSAVATVLHPAVLEMLEASIKYLFACFNYAAAQELTAEPKKSFPLERWQGYLDLAAIQMPLSGIISDDNLILDTNVRGQELIHRFGTAGADNAPLSTRLLLRYEGFDDDDIPDSEMFGETRESRLLTRTMLDYLDMHPHARDGISLAVYRDQDIQPVITAIHDFLNELASSIEPGRQVLSEDRSKPYSVAVTIFTESDEDVGVSRWLEQWQERREAAETEEKFRAYRYCSFSVAHRMVGQDEHQQFRRMIADGLEVDIAVLYNFIGAGRTGNDFEAVGRYDVTQRTLRFPILEKAFCAINDPHHALQRSRIISNRQFRLGALHAEIMARLKNKTVPPGVEHVVLGFGDYAPWQKVVDELHKRAEWVVCIDANIDERLIRQRSEHNGSAREIIGFGSGVGLHGEANYTISTEQFSLSDISFRLEQSIRELYPDWQATDSTRVAQSVLREAQALSGLSLVRATGIGTHIHDFMAYALARKMLEADPGGLCDQLVSLDAYQHWFEAAESAERPDLLWMMARIGSSGRLELNMRLIECKLGQQSQDYLDKAQRQVENGLRVLIPAFMPKVSGAASTDDDRPDQRYWWLQLHRLIASRTEITYQQQPAVLAALERLADGDYSITWGAAIFAYWTDLKSGAAQKAGEFQFTEGNADLTANIFTIGSEFVRKLCLGDKRLSVDWPKREALFKGSEAEPTMLGQGGGEVVAPELVHVQEREAQAQPTATEGPIPAAPVKIPDRILLGRAERGGRNVYWEFGHSELSNRHILIFGTSGMGKTYAIQCLLCELGKAGQNSLVLDYTNGFLPKQLEPETKRYLKPSQHIVRQNPLPISPFKLQSVVIGEDIDEMKETEVVAAKRIASVFKKLYGTIGDQQYPILMDAVIAGIRQYGDGLTLEQFQSVLEEFVEDGKHEKARVQATLNKLRPFMLENPFSSNTTGIGWDRLFSEVASRCHVFQFAGMDTTSSQLVVEFVLWDLNAFVRGAGSKNLPKVVVLDEVQNLDLTESAPVAKYLTEGRKFGLSLILATQSMENLKGDKLSRLFQAGHKLFFRPSENEFQEHAKLIQSSIGGSVSEWVGKLAGLKKGECYSLGPSLNTVTTGLEQMAFKIQVTSLSERGFDA